MEKGNIRKGDTAIRSEGELIINGGRIANADTGFISKASGVGKKSAERVVVDLRDKVGTPSKYGATDVKYGVKKLDESDEALDALIALGFQLKEATAALAEVDASLPVEERVRLALKG